MNLLAKQRADEFDHRARGKAPVGSRFPWNFDNEPKFFPNMELWPLFGAPYLLFVVIHLDFGPAKRCHLTLPLHRRLVL